MLPTQLHSSSACPPQVSQATALWGLLCGSFQLHQGSQRGWKVSQKRAGSLGTSAHRLKEGNMPKCAHSCSQALSMPHPGHALAFIQPRSAVRPQGPQESREDVCQALPHATHTLSSAHGHRIQATAPNPTTLHAALPGRLKVLPPSLCRLPLGPQRITHRYPLLAPRDSQHSPSC